MVAYTFAMGMRCVQSVRVSFHQVDTRRKPKNIETCKHLMRLGKSYGDSEKFSETLKTSLTLKKFMRLCKSWRDWGKIIETLKKWWDFEKSMRWPKLLRPWKNSWDSENILDTLKILLRLWKKWWDFVLSLPVYHKWIGTVYKKLISERECLGSNRVGSSSSSVERRRKSRNTKSEY